MTGFSKNLIEHSIRAKRKPCVVSAGRTTLRSNKKKQMKPLETFLKFTPKDSDGKSNRGNN